MGKADIDKLKGFLSSAVDDYRAPYARSVTSIPRRSVFFGTVNPDGTGYLRDSTGNRRFWPVATDDSDQEIDIAGLAAVRDQLWAEAVEVLRSDPAVVGRDWADVDTNQLTVGRWWPKGDELALFRDSQEERLTADAWADPIASYLRKPTTSDTWVTVADVLADALSIDKGKWTQADQSRAARCMALLGWRRTQRRDRGVRAWGYAPPEDWQRSHLQLVPSPL